MTIWLRDTHWRPNSQLWIAFGIRACNSTPAIVNQAVVQAQFDHVIKQLAQLPIVNVPELCWILQTDLMLHYRSNFARRVSSAYLPSFHDDIWKYAHLRDDC